jgi:hypothetical protein
MLDSKTAEGLSRQQGQQRSIRAGCGAKNAAVRAAFAIFSIIYQDRLWANKWGKE